MKERRLKIALTAEESVSAILNLPEDGRTAGTGVIAAHGAGNDMETPLLAAFAEGLAEAGTPTLRFNFLYKEKGRKAPDRPEKLEAAWMAAWRYFREESGVDVSRTIAAGKSMGGRIASQMAASGKLPVEGLVFLGYPLHPAGNSSRRRDAHLYQLKIPLLFFAGTRDPLCDLTTLQTVLGKLTAPRQLEIIEGGDHSFKTPKSMGTKESEIFDRIIKKTLQWLEGIQGA